MKLPAKDIQAMLGVEDDVVIAYGYTFDRDSVYIMFHKGWLVRSDYRRDELVRLQESHTFQPCYFQDSMKRWYRGTDERGINPRLLDLFETFGAPLSVVEGGKGY